MTNEEFLKELARVRALVAVRLEQIRAGQQVHSTEEEILFFLQNLDDVEKEVRSGSFALPRGQRTLACAERVGDTWPYSDPLGLELVSLDSAYRKL